MPRPNIIAIVADDLGYGDLGAFGNPIVRTPNLDRLVDGGVSLTQHYSASPMCAPARASLLTGRYNHRTGAVDVAANRGLDRIALTERTLGDVFRNAGYRTGLIGKWHNGAHDPRYHPNARGFDTFAGFLNGGMDYWRWVLDVNGQPHPSDGRYLTDVLTDRAIEFIRADRTRPFMLVLAYNAPHKPLQAPDDRIARYRSYDNLTEAVRTIYAMIEIMDDGVGRILEALAEAGIDDNTIVMFTSDNGPLMKGSGAECTVRYNGEFRGAKGDVLEGGIRVPAIVTGPDGVNGGRRVDDMIHFADWLPTLAAMAGLDDTACDALDGVDVSPLLRGQRLSTPPVRFWQWNRYEPIAHCNGAMRDGPWKLYWPWMPEARFKLPEDTAAYERGLTEPHQLGPIDPTLPHRTLSTEPAPKLFNLDDDVHETTDLAGRFPDRVRAMTRQWDRWFDTAVGQWRDAHASNIHP